MYRVAVCDDEGEQAEALQAAVSAWGSARGIPCNAQAFLSGESLWFAWQGGAFDILLLDVEMGKTSGIELDKSLRAAGSRAEIVFITSHFEFAGEGYEVDALHYLLKPVSREKLFQVLDKAAARLSQEPPSLVITSGGERVKLYAPDILYVESFRHDIVIHTRTGEYQVKESISAFGDRLRAVSPMFYRAHRSYLISLQAMTRIGRTSVTLENTTELPLARGKYDDINRAFIEQN